MMSFNENKSMNESLQLLIKKLRHLQHDLESTLWIDDFIYNKLINACQKISACQYACFKSSEILTELINDLKSSIIIYQKAHFIEFSFFIEFITYFIDRRYHRIFFFHRVHYLFHRSSLSSQFSVSNQSESSRTLKSRTTSKTSESKTWRSYAKSMLRLSERRMLVNEAYKRRTRRCKTKV